MVPDLIPNLSVDCVVFGFDFEKLNILLIERHMMYQNTVYNDMKLPGDLIKWNENIDEAAIRTLNELTGLNNIYMKQFHSFGAIHRVDRRPRDMQWLISIDHPEERVITIGYYSLINIKDEKISETLLKQNAKWVPVNEVGELAFDHNLIINKALESLRSELKSYPIGFELLPEKFTLTQMQKLYETVFSTQLDKRNFRKKVTSMSYVVPINEKQKGVAHKPARLYMFSKDVYQKTKKDNFDFTV